MRIKMKQLENAYIRAGKVFEGQMAQSFGLADRTLLVKCYDNKMVKSPG